MFSQFFVLSLRGDTILHKDCKYTYLSCLIFFWFFGWVEEMQVDEIRFSNLPSLSLNGNDRHFRVSLKGTLWHTFLLIGKENIYLSLSAEIKTNHFSLQRPTKQLLLSSGIKPYFPLISSPVEERHWLSHRLLVIILSFTPPALLTNCCYCWK